MPLETGDSIADLDEAWPLGGDPTNQGDNHLRLIKAVLKSQFPGVNGSGYNEPILSTEFELNQSVGIIGNIQEQINALHSAILDLTDVLTAPPGTSMIFYQLTAPVGWTQDLTNIDHMTRVVGVVGGGSAGGVDSPIINDKVPLHTHVTEGAGLHKHTVPGSPGVGQGAAGANTVQQSAGVVESSEQGAHDHVILPNVGAASWQPLYVNVIIAVKD